MQTYTTTLMSCQLVSQTLQPYDLSQTAKQDMPGLISYKYNWQEQEVLLPATQSEHDLLSEVMLSQLYAEFAQEDRELANAGLADYAHSLAVEDSVE